MTKRGIFLSALIVLILYIAMNYTSGHAQTTQTVRVTQISDALRQGSPGMQVSGRIVGFACAADHSGSIHCYVASTD